MIQIRAPSLSLSCHPKLVLNHLLWRRVRRAEPLAQLPSATVPSHLAREPEEVTEASLSPGLLPTIPTLNLPWQLMQTIRVMLKRLNCKFFLPCIFVHNYCIILYCNLCVHVFVHVRLAVFTIIHYFCCYRIMYMLHAYVYTSTHCKCVRVIERDKQC